MDKYDYYVEVTNDVECWLDQNDFDLSQFENREEAAEYLYDILWAEDNITGNGNSWYDTECCCEEYICHNLDLLFEALFEFGEMEEMLLDNIHKYTKKKALHDGQIVQLDVMYLVMRLKKHLLLWKDMDSNIKIFDLFFNF